MYIYLIGSLRNPRVPEIGEALRQDLNRPDVTVFDDWFAAGPEADDCWQRYEQSKGNTFPEALRGEAAKNVFQFDLKHLNRADVAVLILPAGKSGHMEFGWCLGKGKRGYILLEDQDPGRWDVMYQFANAVFYSVRGLLSSLQEWKPPSLSESGPEPSGLPSGTPNAYRPYVKANPAKTCIYL